MSVRHTCTRARTRRWRTCGTHKHTHTLHKHTSVVPFEMLLLSLGTLLWTLLSFVCVCVCACVLTCTLYVYIFGLCVCMWMCVCVCVGKMRIFCAFPPQVLSLCVRVCVYMCASTYTQQRTAAFLVYPPLCVCVYVCVRVCVCVCVSQREGPRAMMQSSAHPRPPLLLQLRVQRRRLGEVRALRRPLVSA